MKLVIPDIVESGHLDYRIIFDDKSLQVADSRAQVNYAEQTIRLSKYGTYSSDRGTHRSPAAILEALLHELLHVHNNLWCADELTEQQVEALAAGLTQSLISLGIEPDFSRIPEE